MMLESATVHVVDDDPSILRSLKRLLKTVGLEVRTYASAREFLESESGGTGLACLVLDVRMPGINGPKLQDELVSRGQAIPIVFITGHGDVPTGVSAMKKGAVDFITKPFEDEVLIAAVREALQKSAEMQATLDERKAIQERLDLLTPRELEVASYVITGLLNKQIAHALNITEKTVIVHRGRVMEKMGVGSVAELVRLAEKVGLEPAEPSP
jgi:FixJ family two-component response regulator